MIYIKYHPRDPQKYRNKTLSTIVSLGLKYKVLSEEINIPVPDALGHAYWRFLFGDVDRPDQ